MLLFQKVTCLDWHALVSKGNTPWLRCSCVERYHTLTEYRLVDLVVRRPPRERKVPGSNPACVGIFSGSSHTSDLKIGTPVAATLPGAWRYRVSAGTGRPGVSILWLGEVERLICNLYLSVAARTIVWADPPLRCSCCWDVKQPTNKQTNLDWDALVSKGNVPWPRRWRWPSPDCRRWRRAPGCTAQSQGTGRQPRPERRSKHPGCYSRPNETFPPYWLWWETNNPSASWSELEEENNSKGWWRKSGQDSGHRNHQDDVSPTREQAGRRLKRTWMFTWSKVCVCLLIVYSSPGQPVNQVQLSRSVSIMYNSSGQLVNHMHLSTLASKSCTTLQVYQQIVYNSPV